MGTEIIILQALLVLIDLLQTQSQSKLTAEQRQAIRDARKAVAKAIREQE